MKIRRHRSQIEHSVRVTMPWDEVFVGDMRSADRDIFQRRISAIDLYVNGAPQAEILLKTKIKTSDLHRLMNRCVSIAEDGLVWGARALIPHYRIKEYQREAPVKPKLPEQKGGYAGVMGGILRRYPDLQTDLAKKILKLGKNPDLLEFRMKPQTLHRIFLDELKIVGHPSTEWPFNTKYQGGRTISEFMKQVLDLNFDKQVEIYHEQGAKAHLSVGNGSEATIRVNQVYEAWEVDSHKVDAEFSIGVRNADGLMSYINLKRINILALVDRASTAVVWFLVVYSSEVSATDVVRLITESLRDTLPAPVKDLLGMQIKGDAGFPSEKIPELQHALPGILMPDNALSNLAAPVSMDLRRRLGFYLNYGPPGHFECRPNVEHTFKNIAEGIFQRMPNTTGSNPMEGRAGKSAEIARKYQIEAEVVEELAYHHFAQHNALQSEGIGYLTPLEFIRQKLNLLNQHFIPRRLLRSQVTEILNYRIVRKVKVKCYPKRGIRPYVQLDRVRYSNAILKKTPWLKDSTISVEIDEQDYRTVKAYFPDGAPIGVLTASGKWSRTKHSRKTRVAINRLRSLRTLTITESDDPVEYYLKYLHTQVLRAKGVVSKPLGSVNSRSVATEIGRVNQEVSVERPDLLSEYLGELPSMGAVDTDNKCEGMNSSGLVVPDLSTSSVVKSVMPTTTPDLKGLMKGFQ